MRMIGRPGVGRPKGVSSWPLNGPLITIQRLPNHGINLQISKEWLASPVSEWPHFEDFKTLESFVSNLVVVNDTAEQGCNLATTHGGILTQNEVQQQHIFHGVQDNRIYIPKITKKNLNAMRF